MQALAKCVSVSVFVCLAVSVQAQVFRAEIGFQGGSSGWTAALSESNASTSAYGINQGYLQGYEGYSQAAPDALSARVYVEQYYAVSYRTSGRPRWMFEDVVFSAPTPMVSVQINTLLEMAGVSSSIYAGHSAEIHVLIENLDHSFSDMWVSPVYPNPNGIVPVTSAPLTVTANVPVRVIISPWFDVEANGGGNGFEWARAEGSLTLASIPFTVTPGVTVDSPQAHMSNNNFAPPISTMAPGLSTPETVTAGTPVDLTLDHATPGALGFLMVCLSGTEPVPSTYGPWLSLHLRQPLVVLAPLVVVDANGEAAFSFPLPAWVHGFPLTFQSVVFTGGAPGEVYGTNTVYRLVP
jgi:hypothetical protein